MHTNPTMPAMPAYECIRMHTMPAINAYERI